VDEEEVSAGWMAEDGGALMLGAVTGHDGALHGDKACDGAGTCSARSTDDVSDCMGGSSSDSMAGWLGGNGNYDGGGGGKGGEQHPSICGICLFLARFLSGGAGCGDTIGGSNAG
jgi:hypothetical protein